MVENVIQKRTRIVNRTAANDDARVALEFFVEPIDVEGLLVGDTATNVDDHVATLELIRVKEAGDDRSSLCTTDLQI